MNDKSAKSKRDTQAGRQRLIAAVGNLLGHEGVRGLGINALAKQAAVDKVLIYRYFGGLDGLLLAWAEDADLWPSSHELCGGDVVSFYRLPTTERAVQMVRNLIQGLRDRPISRELLAWELLAPHPLCRVLQRQRHQRLEELTPLLQTASEKELGNSAAPLLMPILHAAIYYLLASTRKGGEIEGLSLDNDADWQKLANNCETLIRLNAEMA